MPNAGETKKIWAGSREIGLEEPGLRDVVEAISGQRSISALSAAHTRRLIDRLVELRTGGGIATAPKGAKPSGRREPAGVLKLITPGQRGEISRLRGEVGGDFLRDEYFAGVCLKRIKKAAPVTAGDAAKVIEALKARLRYEQEKAGG